MVEYRWISCNSVLNRIVGEDTLFSGKYTLDPYQKCDIGCVYCDSAEDVVYIKSNVVDVLEMEIEKVGKEKVIVGSTSDPYQRIEKEQGLTRRVVDTLVKHGVRFHILTKSDIILRDISLLRKSRYAEVTISLSTLNESYARIIEPLAPPPERRLEVIKRLSDNGIKTGVAIMPILPFITELEDIIKLSKSAGANYLVYEYLELKGIFRERYLNFVERFFPQYSKIYKRMYQNIYRPENYNVDETIREYCKRHNMNMGYR